MKKKNLILSTILSPKPMRWDQRRIKSDWIKQSNVPPPWNSNMRKRKRVSKRASSLTQATWPLNLLLTWMISSKPIMVRLKRSLLKRTRETRKLLLRKLEWTKRWSMLVSISKRKVNRSSRGKRIRSSSTREELRDLRRKLVIRELELR